MISLTVQSKTQDVGGRVIDQNGEPLGFVSVALLSADSTYIQGATSDENGFFQIQTTDACCILRLSFIGYRTQYDATVSYPDYRQHGFATKHLGEIEKHYPQKRYELFTSTRSIDNIRLYQRMGYREFDRRSKDDGLDFVYMVERKGRPKAELDAERQRQFDK